MSFIAKFIAKLIIYFIGLSLAFVLVFKFVPVPITITMIADENGATRDWEPLSNMDVNIVRAVIAAEDSKFCLHNGFDTEAIENALIQNAKGGRIRGGSTISQQTAKNVFLWQGGGYVRKGFEAWFTFLIEHIWGKRRIIEVYLNVAETGIGTYGVESGAQRYFRHSAARLSTQEAARMAAALPLPKQREVARPTGATRHYGAQIIRRMRIVARDGLSDCVYKSA